MASTLPSTTTSDNTSQTSGLNPNAADISGHGTAAWASVQPEPLPINKGSSSKQTEMDTIPLSDSINNNNNNVTFNPGDEKFPTTTTTSTASPIDPSDPTDPTPSNLNRGRRDSRDVKKHEAKLRADEQIMELPKNNLLAVFSGLMLCMFLAAMDATIVATALPTICEKLTCTSADYGWIASSYMLGSTVFMPLYGRGSDIVGRKPIMFGGILIFLLASGLCGAAKTANWMIICRAIQGIGGGAIMSMTQVIISDIVSLRDRGKYVSWIGVTWALASVLGPLLGGIITNNGDFAWCFWLNLPTGGFAIAVLAFFLRLNPIKRKPLREHVNSFDFIGLILIITGTVCLLTGFAEATNIGWTAPVAPALTAVGGAILIGAIVWEFFTSSKPLIPPRLFRNRTTALLFVSVVMHGICFFTGSFYLPVYFQAIQGVSPTLSGVLCLPYMMVSAFSAVCSGLYTSRTGNWKWVLVGGWGIFLLGTGLFIDLDEHSSRAKQVLYLLVAGIGMGPLFQGPLIGVQSAMPVEEMAATTQAFVLIRSISTTLGVSISTVIYSDETLKRLVTISGYTIPESLSSNLRGLVNISDPVIRAQVLHAYAEGLRLIWIVMTPLTAIGFIGLIFIKEYSLQTKQVKGKGGAAQPAVELKEKLDDEEAGQVGGNSEGSVRGSVKTDVTPEEEVIPADEKK